MTSTRIRISKEFKSKVVLASFKEHKTVERLAKKFKHTATQISTWRSLALKNFGNVFCSENSDDKESGIDTQVLYAQIGELNVQNELLKKSCVEKSR
jgi:transposase-like protein